jgi:hypothetical protein
MKNGTAIFMAALLIGGSGALTGCGRDSGSDVQNIGQVEVALVLPGGAVLNTVSYAVTGPGGFSRMATFDVSHSATISGILSLPTGGPYTLTLSGTSTDGSTTCGGMATFSVTAHTTTPVSVHVLCHQGTTTGSVMITGAINICPAIDGISATPSEVIVGSTLALGGAAHDTDGAPAALTYAWSAPSGTFSSATAQNPMFKCTESGTVTVSLTVSDGDATAGCADTQSVPVICSPITSSQAPYLVPVAPGVLTKAILTAGDSSNSKPDGTPYRMVGCPDGLGAFDNADGSFTLLSNHELTLADGIPRAHGGKGAFVSRWIIRKSDLAVLHGEDLTKQTVMWNPATTSYNAPNTGTVFSRFCSADLPAPSALYDAPSGLGFNGRLFMDGEESGNEGRAMAHGMDGVSYELPRLGKMSFENSLANPATGVTTLVAVDDDTTTPGGEVYFYVGTKTNTGSPVDKAGLTNGLLYGLKVTGFSSEPNVGGIPASPFSLEPLGNVENSTGTALEASSFAAGVTEFQRPEDGAWDPMHPGDYYFVTTASFTGNSRLWRARFTDLATPLVGGTIEMLLDGSEGQKMMDNIAIDKRGHIEIVEDVGNNAWIGRVLRYDIATDTLSVVGQHDPNRFVVGAPAFLTQDEEASGIIDASDLLGAGWWLVDVQAHYNPGDVELFEGGQYVAIFDPATL